MLKLSVRVGESVAIGGPTTLRIEQKSGQVVGITFDADRSVPIRLIPTDTETETGAPKPRGAPLGLGLGEGRKPSPGLGPR